MKDKRSRCFEIILYQDFENFNEFLDQLNNDYNIIYILHDRDVYEEDSEDHAKGEIKKPHYHILFRFENAKYKSTFVNQLAYPENLITPVSNYKKFLLYMIHFNDPYKFNYSLEDVKGSPVLINELSELIQKNRGESYEIKMLFDYVNDFTTFVYMEDLITFSLNNGLWSTFRRNYSILKNYIFNYNHLIDSKLNKKGGDNIEKIQI